MLPGRAADAGEIRPDTAAQDLVRASGNLAAASGDGAAVHIERMAMLLVDGLRHRPSPIDGG